MQIQFSSTHIAFSVDWEIPLGALDKLLDTGIALFTDCLELNRNRCLKSIYI